MIDSQFAFVLLDRAFKPDMEAIFEALSRRHPDIPVSPVGPGTSSTNAAPSMISCDGKTVAIVLVPSQLQHDDGLLVRAATVWPEARPHFNGHRAHLGVWVIGYRDSQLEIARVITAVVGSLLETLPRCLGVVWDDKALYPADYWLEMSKSAFAPYPNFPSLLWFSMQDFGDRLDDRSTVVTQGLQAFTGCELELTAAGTERKLLRPRAHALAAYLMQNGPAGPDQTSFRIFENEQVVAHHRESAHIPGLPVIAARIADPNDEDGENNGAIAATTAPGTTQTDQAEARSQPPANQSSPGTNPVATGLRRLRAALKRLVAARRKARTG